MMKKKTNTKKKEIKKKKISKDIQKKEAITIPTPPQSFGNNDGKDHAGCMESVKKLKEFKDIRSKCKEHIKTEMYQDLKDVKNLDDHILSFVKTAKIDLKNNNPADVKNVTKQFEDEIYEEINSILKNAKEDMELLKEILNALNTLKKDVDFKSESPKLVGLEKYEIRYAESVIDTAKNRLDEIKKTFETLKNN